MDLRLRNRRLDGSDELRARIIAETCLYLAECLRRPELAARIPVVEAGKGAFPPSLTESFWGPILLD